ncbi:MAG TPA: hypothetical protein IAC11_01120 [Candidatus Limiplasma pullicola]|nr:hypothetical protein [Candidatus Limiplasma pullicola]
MLHFVQGNEDGYGFAAHPLAGQKSSPGMCRFWILRRAGFAMVISPALRKISPKSAMCLNKQKEKGHRHCINIGVLWWWSQQDSNL